MNKYLVVTVVVSNILFVGFLATGVYFWLENRAVKVEARQSYERLLAAESQCDQDNFTDDTYCRQMGIERHAMDRYIQASSHFDSLTRLFIAFAVFLPLFTWASYFLTRAIFY